MKKWVHDIMCFKVPKRGGATIRGGAIIRGNTVFQTWLSEFSRNSEYFVHRECQDREFNKYHKLITKWSPYKIFKQWVIPLLNGKKLIDIYIKKLMSKKSSTCFSAIFGHCRDQNMIPYILSLSTVCTNYCSILSHK